MKTKPNPFISSLHTPTCGPFRVLTPILAMFVALTSAAHAVDGTWAVDAGGNWNDAANWSSNPTVPGGAGSTVGLTFDISGAKTVTINTTSATVGTLNIGDPAASPSVYTLGASSASLILDNSGTGGQINHLSTGAADTITAPVSLLDNLAISNAATTALSISGITAGSAGTKTITNSGSGTGAVTLTSVIGNGTGTVAVIQNSATSQLTLSGTNTFAGGVTLSAGTLSLNNNAALGTGTFTINNGTTIAVTAARTTTNNNNQNWNGDFTFNGGNTLNLGTGAVTMSASRAVTVSASTLTVGGAIGETSSGFSLTKEGAGTLILSGANTYSGGTRVNGGILQFNTGAVPASGLITIGSGGTLNASAALPLISDWLGKITTDSSGVLALTAASSENINLTGYNGLSLGGSASSVYSGTLTPAGTTYRLGGGGSTLTVSSALTGSGNSLVVGSGSSTGTVVLTAVNTYGGATTVNSGTLSLSGATGSAASSAITANGGTTLTFDSSASGVGGTTRASTVTLKGASLNVLGNDTVNSNDTITGALTVSAPAPNASGAANALTITPNAATNTQLTAGSLVRANNGAAFFRGTSLGANTIASATANTSNIVFTSAPTAELVGGDGAAGSQNIKILPWAVGATSASGAPSSFVTYDANGIRPLTSGEYETAIPATAATNNVKLSGASPVTVNGATTVNSLFLSNTSGSAVVIVAGTAGSLTVTSGAIYADFSLGGNSNALTISKPVDFGAVEGVIGTMATGNSKTLAFSGGISGSGGITIYDANGLTTTAQAGVNFNGANTYTGNTVINGTLIASGTNALPNFTNSSRTGDVYVNGTLGLSGTNNSTVRINGLYGNGRIITPFSNNETFIVGDNNATSTFGGTIVQTTGAIGLTKVGTGTLTLTGTSNTWTAATNVQNGTLSVITLNNIAAPATTSTLGRPTTLATGTIAMGATTTTGQLTVTGTGETTDRVINLAGTTGGARLDQSGTGLLKFTSAFTATGAGSKTLTLQGSTAGTGEIAAAIVDNSGTNKTSVVKAGTGTWTLSGVNTYTGSTTVSGGTLNLGTASLSDTSVVDVATGAVLNLSHGGTDVVAEFRINGVSQGNGTFNASNSLGRITGSGSLQVGAGSDPFLTWIGTYPSITGPDTAKTADPDHDGLTNFVEFALDGNPASGTATGKVRSRVETVGADQALVITLPVRAGAVFDNLPGPAADASVDNLIYTIAGTNDLTTFDQGVTEIAASSSGMPALTSASWTYRSFRLNGAVGGATPRGPKGFLRAGITSTP